VQQNLLKFGQIIKTSNISTNHRKSTTAKLTGSRNSNNIISNSFTNQAQHTLNLISCQDHQVLTRGRITMKCHFASGIPLSHPSPVIAYDRQALKGLDTHDKLLIKTDFISPLTHNFVQTLSVNTTIPLLQDIQNDGKPRKTSPETTVGPACKDKSRSTLLDVTHQSKYPHYNVQLVTTYVKNTKNL